MPCGCQSACGCNIVAGPGINVNRIGDNFTVTNTAPSPGGVPVFVQQTAPVGVVGPYVWYEIDGLGAFVALWIESGI
jgi:hypothetical protein